MDDLTREFLIESQEGLDRMERCLTDLEERPGDTNLLSDIFRSVHTIKGTTGFLGFKRLEKLAHAGENLLGALRDGKLSASQPVITGLLQLLDALRSILSIIESSGLEGETDEEVNDSELIALMHELQHPGDALHSATNVNRPALVIEANTTLTHTSAKASPPALQEPDTAPPPPSQSAAAAENDALKSEAAETSRPRQSAASESTLRVDITLLNRMMNLVGELVLTRNQILQATGADPAFTMLSRRLDMVTADLRESVMKARMQPVSSVFSKFPRIVRDLTQLLNRRVKLVLEGQETELDKSLLEAIKDPLTHAVRNSLDHGIEPPEKRIALGKDPEGTLKLRAYQESGHVIIEVSDDGGGISVEKVRDKAIERSLITAERAAHLSERELLQLIFLPGFSTAAAITNVSGRGVGMDVVRTNVEKIGGKVEIDSRPGKGTTLRLRIPLTLAIIPALIVRCLGQSFALPQGVLSELVHIPPERISSAIEWMEGAPLYRLRGQLLPLIFLDRMLSERKPVNGHAAIATHTPDAASLPQRDHFIAVLDADGRMYGLVVDGLADPEEIVVKPLSTVLKSIGIYSGATVLGNGDLALILDPGAIAIRAGVSLSTVQEDIEILEEEEDAMKSRFLLVEAAQRRAAVPLGEVLRIERIPVSRIEYIGYRPVLNFEGQLLPVEDSAGVLATAAANPDLPLTIVVCREGNRQVGIAVGNVLDVAAGNDLVEAGTHRAAAGVTLLNDHVTGIVDLGAIEPLPLAAQAASSWQSSANSYEETLA
ncbi:chemotaxis protein CheW [Acidicapsa dinghuensis]|uniref:histidine kinase n=1 Tax=Acidicapsa dinghuensis TaxID=2218256 RepID=A0ABW1EHJ5_9BACT|nr:chemotaxis protein CheW [Acidicapsa dinghuensis]